MHETLAFILWILAVPLPLVLFCVANEVRHALNGEREAQKIIAAHVELSDAVMYLEGEYTSWASFQDRGEMTEPQLTTLNLLWERVEVLESELRKLDLPFWRDVRFKDVRHEQQFLRAIGATGAQLLCRQKVEGSIPFLSTILGAS